MRAVKMHTLPSGEEVSTRELANRLSVHHVTLYKWIRDFGVKGALERAAMPKGEVKYPNGQTGDEICAEFGITKAEIAAGIRWHGFEKWLEKIKAKRAVAASVSAAANAAYKQRPAMAICPTCRKKHRIPDWQGTGTPRVYCPVCRVKNNGVHAVVF